MTKNRRLSYDLICGKGLCLDELKQKSGKVVSMDCVSVSLIRHYFWIVVTTSLTARRYTSQIFSYSVGQKLPPFILSSEGEET
jgi:hypothetical protein